MDTNLKESKQKMAKSLKNIVVPEIKSLVFSGVFPHFRRMKNNKYEFISFQFNRYGGSFVLEIGFLDPNKLLPFEKALPFEKLNYGNARDEDRLRIQPDNNQEDYWYDYSNFTEDNQFKNLSELVKSLLYKVELFLK